MKLRSKTLIIVGATLICLMTILYVLARHVFLDGFKSIERENAVRNVERMIDAFAENTSHLSLKCMDWAKRDDTYHFIRNRNEKYVESNLGDASVADLRLHFMFFLSDSGEIVFSRGYDPLSELWFEPSDTMKSFILADTLFGSPAGKGGAVEGFVLSPDGPLTIVSRPIIRSDSQGPVRGAVIFARRLDKAESDHIAQLIHLPVTAEPITSSLLTWDMKKVIRVIGGVDSVTVMPVSKDTVGGYAIMRDIHGDPAIIARVNLYRSIVKQGRVTLVTLMFFMLAAVLVFGLIMVILLERSVIARVSRLSRDVKLISNSGDHSRRVALQGGDELANLAASLNHMLSALQTTETAVRERNNRLRLIMNTIPTGLLVLDENCRVSPEYTQSAEAILEAENLADRDFFELLGLTDARAGEREQLAEFLDLFRNEALEEEEMAGLNPFDELRLGLPGGSFKWIRLRFHLIRREPKAPRHLLAVIEDITSEKLLAEKVRSSERENLQLKAIVEDPDLFREFLAETQKILRNAEEKLENIHSQEDQLRIVNEVFRDVHTIKGTAASFGLSTVSEIAGALEDKLARLRENGAVESSLIESGMASLGLLAKAIMDAVANVKKIMGDEFVDDSDIYLRISLTKLKSESAAIKELLCRELIDVDLARRLQEDIDRKLRSFRHLPARRGFSKALKIVPELLAKIPKDIRFDFEGAEVPIDCEVARELNTPIVHLIRNAFDHGIEESPAERTAAGKPAAGRVKLTIRGDDTNLAIEVTDDGRGIDEEAVKSIAIRKGILTPSQAGTISRDDLFSLICVPGFSTTTEITEISGRGVGMDVVLNAVTEKLRGKIFISSQPGKGTTFAITIPSPPS